MSDPVALATERLADVLLDAVLDALKAKAFYPSDRFIEALELGGDLAALASDWAPDE